MNPTRKIWYDKNNAPQTNYIWYKNGKYLEFINGKWTETSGMNSGTSSGISSDMSETEQMQARKDLGLYYEETTTGEKEVVSDGYTSTKLSDDVPAKDDIISVSGMTSYIIEDIENGYNIWLVAIGQILAFTVLTSGNDTGIFSGDMYSVNAKLVYKAETTVVHKVPERFLPVAWEQLVTEGTKIAELTIGEETTDVFAPEGDGSTPEYVQISDELSDMDEVDVTMQFGISADDYIALCKGEKGGLHYYFSLGNAYYQFISGFYSQTLVSACSFLVFRATDNTIWKFIGIPSYVTVTHYVLATGAIPGPVVITGLPEASMTTTAELDEIGLTSANITKLARGNATGLCYRNEFIFNYSFLGLDFASEPPVSSPFTYSIMFHDAMNNYYVSVISGTVTVTVTQLS